jgi:uncharacterized protein YkwD
MANLADTARRRTPKGSHMRSFARRLVMLAVVPAALFGVVAMASPAEAAAVPTVATLQNDIVRYTNAERVAHGCSPLRVDAKLGYAARVQSGYMARTGHFSHTGASNSTFVARIGTAGYSGALSENIAWGYRSGAQVVAAWMKSPGHRANLLNCSAKAVGVGAIYAANGNPYFTQDFGTR